MTGQLPHLEHLLEARYEQDAVALQTAMERRDHARTLVGRSVGKIQVFWRQMLIAETQERLEAAQAGIVPDQSSQLSLDHRPQF